MPSKVIIIAIVFMFLGINIFWALLRAHFNPRLTAPAKMSLSRAQNIFMSVNINIFASLWTSTSSRSIRTQKEAKANFSVFISVDVFGFLVFEFHPDREITENLFYCHGKCFA